MKTYTTETRFTSVRLTVSHAVVYYYEGKIHRELGPAIEGYDTAKGASSFLYPNTSKTLKDKIKVRVWVKNGKLHNDFGPAIKESNGDYVYMRNGKIHRVGDLPAAENCEKIQYMVNGKLHRLSGPALEFKDPSKKNQNRFCIDGVELPREAHINYDRKIKLDDILTGPDEPLEMLRIQISA